MQNVRIAFIGAGIMGRHHIAVARRVPGIEIVGIAELNPQTRDRYAAEGIPTFADHHEMLAEVAAEGAVISTPNAYHASAAIDCLAAGVVPLIEKPVADTVAAGLGLREAQRASGLPALVGHHRRHNPIIKAAVEHVRAGGLGQVLAVNGLWLRRKPDEYFQEAWKTDPTAGGGTLLINAIHDIDSLRAICGEIVAVSAMTSNASRGAPVEDTAAILMRFASGAVGTFLISDNVVAPWCWEMTSQEDPRFAWQPENSYVIAGTEASLAVPTLETWSNSPNGGRDATFIRRKLYHVAAESMELQMQHFLRVIRREEEPLADVESALATLAVVEAIKLSAAQGREVAIADLLG
ncbi:Gfo/Idh/MocA family protein [Paracoccus litorisediminis]|nr:Gfo/Idh/MocA family oxidoreductase [Paracoccus litorisediminis]